MSDLAICPAHGWWATYFLKDDREHVALRVLYWESSSEERSGIVQHVEGGLVDAELAYGDEGHLMDFLYDPIAYDDSEREVLPDEVRQRQYRLQDRDRAARAASSTGP